MPQQHEANQLGTTSAAPATWREALSQAHQIDGLPLLPLYGKRPRCGTGWEDQGHSVEAILGWAGITGVGLRTGQVLAGGHGLICFDFDGAAAQIRALELACDPHAIDTWKIRRIDADGQPVTDRFKLVFRTSPEQAQYFAEWGAPDKDGARRGAQWQMKAEGGDLEVFHHTGRQIAILGVYPRKGTAVWNHKLKTEIPIDPQGHYHWADGEGFEALADLPANWYALAQSARDEHNSRTDRENNAIGKAKGRSGKTTRGADWYRIGNCSTDSCPICGRDSGGGCREHIDGKSVWCLHGDTFSPISAHGLLKRGKPYTGFDGQPWGWVREQDFGVFGRPHSLFVIDDPDRIRPDHNLVAQPQPWQQPTTPTSDWMASLPGSNGNGNGNGNGHNHSAAGVTIEVQATEAGTTIEAAGGTSALAVEQAIAAHIETLAADLQRHGKKLDDRLEPEWAPRFDALLNAVASLEVRRGAPSPALKDAAVARLGFGKRDWTNEVKARAVVLKADQARRREIARVAESAEAQAALVPVGDTALDEGQAFQWAVAMLPPGPGPEISPKKREVMRAFDHLASTRTNALRLNSITNAVELLPPDAITPIVLPAEQVQNFYLPMAIVGWEVGKELASDALLHFARCNTYNPVQEYLLAIAHDPAVPVFDLSTAASTLLGVADPLSAVLLRKTLIQAVARAMNPGARAEGVCVLQGPQGALKSSFWRELMPNPRWHIDTIPEDSKDFQLQQHRCWVFELGEIDHLLRSYDASHLKRLITSRFDLVRPPYGRTAIECHRPSVMVGTCNPADFFRDDENRRFWVIQVPSDESVNLAAVVAHRDAIWKAAFQAWQQGGDDCWWLSAEEKDALKDRNKGFHSEGQFDQALTLWVQRLPAGACFTTVAALLSSNVGIDSQAKATKQLRNEAATTLRLQGWVQSRPRSLQQLSVWHRRAEEPVPALLQPEIVPQGPQGPPVWHR